MEVLVEYDYQAQNPDELSIKKGDRIRNVVRKEEGWYEGEMLSTGRRGVFPDNFVKVQYHYLVGFSQKFRLRSFSYFNINPLSFFFGKRKQ